ncbi:Chanoclavine-I aldehyde reductase fgaOx3 [Achaetomium macrosporum]|uniref:Chanoclavine-I aldehyde reductase fgaOx3 n=1 Tax=Achaetomium macrosporum TaxID=79813 RepID=A0AAN7C2B3_9PEZI|nr:Chanoclavine-I aldehyde reductase fgaOx3 [Achaetomium macrosporum]
MSTLFNPLKVGETQLCSLGHRVAMAPLTRFRSDDAWVPMVPIVKEYYGQRASVPGTPVVSEGMSTEQIAAWRTVTNAVHARGSLIYCQLWHLGRAGDERYIITWLVSSSAIPIGLSSPVPEELSKDKIWDIVAQYTAAARNAIAAGFDGVEIHSANGYLPDQFVQDTCNRRTDAWGGSVENGARFAIEVVKTRLWDNASAVLLAGGFAPEKARQAVDETYVGHDVVIVFGRAFISNLDLVYRIKEGIELAKHDSAVF